RRRTRSRSCRGTRGEPPRSDVPVRTAIPPRRHTATPRSTTFVLELGVPGRLCWAAMHPVTQGLNAIAAGDPHAANETLPPVYDELRQLAAQRWAREAPGQTLEPTALVHEAYLRLVASRERERPEVETIQPPVAHAPGSPEFANRAHFFAAAAE